VRIDYSPGLLSKVRAAGARADTFGMLFGVRRGQTIYFVATSKRAGLEPLGSFISRASGGALLTEDDLRRFDKGPVGVMLIVSGQSAGVFVRDAAGVCGTAGNYQDFAMPASRRGGPPPLPAIVTRPKRRQAAVGASACFALAFAVVALIPFLLGNQQRPVALNVREDGGQLHISWSATAQKMLTILDKGERIALAIGPQQSSLTYARHSGDVTVGIGSAQVRFIGPEPPASAIEQMRTGVEALESRIACLRSLLASGQEKVVWYEVRRPDEK
jgi:hypothetical protein